MRRDSPSIRTGSDQVPSVKRSACPISSTAQHALADEHDTAVSAATGSRTVALLQAPWRNCAEAPWPSTIVQDLANGHDTEVGWPAGTVDQYRF